MDKLTMAHDYAISMMNNQSLKVTYQEVVDRAWWIADAMQDEADKREVGIKEMMKDHVHDYIYGRVCACGAIKE